MTATIRIYGVELDVEYMRHSADPEVGLGEGFELGDVYYDGRNIAVKVEDWPLFDAAIRTVELNDKREVEIERYRDSQEYGIY